VVIEPPEDPTYRYDVALSFAGQQRWYVERLAKTLVDQGVAVFYDEDAAAELWGKDGIEEFSRLYAKDAFRVLMFVSKEYVDGAWPTVERRAALGRFLSDPNSNHVLLVRFDSTEVPGLPPQRIYQDAMARDPRHSPSWFSSTWCARDAVTRQCSPPLERSRRALGW
jgi:hypothetical protein